jgi:putative restriction endonuclease
MAAKEDAVRAAVRGLRTWKRGEKRAPHKPLLLLYALGRLQRGEPRLVDFALAEPVLQALLDRFGPPRKTHPLYPFWYLRSDGLWEVSDATGLPLRGGDKEPRVTAVRDAHLMGGFPPEVEDALRSNPELLVETARLLLDGHFAESMHEDICEATGLDLHRVVLRTAGRPRPSKFRDEVLRAYEHRCAVCRFQGLLDGSVVGVEAAHVRWHAFAGPGDVDNGIALCVLHHKLFDLGAFGISEERCVLISSRFSADDDSTARLLSHRGRPLCGPQGGFAPVAPAHAEWHRREVFRSPARTAC